MATTAQKPQPDTGKEASLIRAALLELKEDIQLGAVPRAPAPPSHVPAAIGHYRIVGILGEGGMGVVYRAEQENPRRTVALKILRPGLVAPSLLRRFEFESQFLARLHHPGIAQVYEAGTADTGMGPQPYFAMELVSGRPLRDHADAAGLSTRQRLELMARVCDAVQHAHQRGIVHRDLKPGNILVEDESPNLPQSADDRTGALVGCHSVGQPKILDFGVARATDGDLQATTLTTAVGQILGTLAYMSPEQVRADPHDVDTRSDVYSLGVVLYELLARRLPHDISRSSVPEAARLIDQTEPTPLTSVSRAFRGDLATIVHKTLEKDKSRRYQSASELAADIRRFLRDEPIIARPASTLYHLRKFARRNKTLVGVVAGAFVLLLAATVTSTLMYLQSQSRLGRAVFAEGLAGQRLADSEKALMAEKAAYAAAERQADRALRTREVLIGLFDSIDPENARGYNITVREVLDSHLDNLKRELDDEPEVKAIVLETLGTTYTNLGQFDRARELLDVAVDLDRTTFGPASLQLSAALISRARIAMFSGDNLDAGLADCDEAIRILRAAGAPAKDSTLAFAVRARIMRDRGDPSERWAALVPAALQMMLYETKEEDYIPEDRALIRRIRELRAAGDTKAISDLLWAYRVESLEKLRALWASGRHDDAFAEMQTHMDPLIKSPTWRKGVPGILRNLALHLQHDGEDPDVLEPMLRQAVNLNRRLDPSPSSPQTARFLVDLARLLRGRGNLQEAETSLREALATFRDASGPTHFETLDAANELALVLCLSGKPQEAEPLARDTDRAASAMRPARPALRTAARSTLGQVLLAAGKLAEAEQALRDTLTAQTTSLGEKDWQTARTRGLLGQCIAQRSRPEEAEPLLLASYESLKESRGPLDKYTLEARQRLNALYTTTGQPAKAALYAP